MNYCTRFIMQLLVLSCTVTAGAVYAAENWPVRPIRLIIPFGPGGATDIVTRLIQPSLVEALGQQVIADNRPGASGNIAAELAARAAPTDIRCLSPTSQWLRSIRPCLRRR